MSIQTVSSRKLLIAVTYGVTLVLFAAVAWQPGSPVANKSSRLSGPETQTAFLMERFGNPQRIAQ